MSSFFESYNCLYQDTLQNLKPAHRYTVKIPSVLKKTDYPPLDTVNHSEKDTLSYFFYKLKIKHLTPDSMLYKALKDAPEFYVDSTLKAQRKELTTHYDEFKYYMKNINQKPETLFSESRDWITGILFSIFIILLIIKRIKPNFLIFVAQLNVKYREFSKSVPSTNLAESNMNKLLTLNFILSSGMFIFLSFEFYNFYTGLKALHLYGFLLAFIAAIIVLKRLLLFFSGYIIAKNDLIFKYFKNIQLLNNSLGIIIIPFILTIPFVEVAFINSLIYSALFIIVFSYFIRILRGIKIFIEYNVSIFYMILYLCTIEFLPNLLMYKFLELAYKQIL